MSTVKLVHITPDAEKLVAYIARVSSPNQDNPEYDKLITYLMKHSHWSPFQMASMCVEIETSRAISQQIIRHSSFSFQEFSQRYAETVSFEQYPARRQDLKNRQNSIDDMPDNIKEWFHNAQQTVAVRAFELYKEGLTLGIAKEQMRFLLPLSCTTKLYMHGNLRSFIHYCALRTSADTQLEHRNIAYLILDILKKECPVIGKSMITLYNIQDQSMNGKPQM